MLLLLVLAGALALRWCLAALKASAMAAKLEKHFPGATHARPVVGHALEYWGDETHIFATTRRFIKERGSQFYVKMMNEFAVVVSDADGTEAIMTNSKVIKKGPLYEFLLQWLGRGLLTNFGSSWHRRRKLLTPAFHFKILDEFGPMIAHHSTRLVDDLMELARTTKGTVDVVLPVSKITLGTICETAMGVNLQDYGKEDEYFEAVRTVGTSVTYRLIRPWIWRDLIFNLTSYGREMRKCLKVLHGFTRQVIQERKKSHSVDEKTLNGGGQILRKRRLAFLDMMLAAQREDSSLTDDDIREEVDTFMFEGHETTAMAICWTLFSLGNHPDIQERVRGEVLAADADWQAVNALPYLEMVIKESLRLFPPVLYIARENENGIQIGDKVVPPGVALDMMIFEIHRDPVHFPDPERFDPERFSPEQELGRHPFAYVPFSGGLRNCIGKRFAMMELKIMLAAILRTFSFRSEHSMQEIVYRPELVLRPKQGIQLHITPL